MEPKDAGVITGEIRPLLIPVRFYFSIVHYEGQPGWTVGPSGTDYQHVADQIRGWRNVTDALIYHVIPPTL